MSSDEDEGDGRRYNRYESDDEGDVEGTYDEDAWNDSRKRRRGQTKEQAITGSSATTTTTTTRRSRRARGLHGPVNFKSAGGTGGGGAGLGAGKEPEDMFADDDDDARRPRDWARGGASEAAPGAGRSRPRAARGWASGDFSKGNTITSTVENDEEEARTTREGSAPPGWLRLDGTALRRGLRRGGGGGGGEEDGPAAGALNPMDVDENGSDDEDLLPSTFGQRCAPPTPPDFFPTFFETKTFLDRLDRHGRTDTPRAAEPWPLRSRTLSCDSARHACPRTGPATRQVQCAPSGYRVARHRILRRRRRLVRL